jgi:ATP-dependent protease HslVU (ClpYQ) peptidase subunit
VTTVAYADGVMASDTQITSGNRKFRCTKVRQTKDGGLIGGTGNLAQVLKVMRWAVEGFQGDGPEFDGEGDFECIWVTPDGAVHLLDEALEPMKIEDEFLAIGSGGPYAVAAMHLGKSPEEAVEVAARFDPATSGPVQVWRLQPKPKRKRK